MIQDAYSHLHETRPADIHAKNAESPLPIQPKITAEPQETKTTYQTNHAIKFVTEPDTTLDYFTAALVIVGFIQAWVLRSTLIISRASERAYIMVKCENAAGIAVGDKPRAVIVLKNFGKTPAYRLQHQSQISFAVYPMSDDYTLPKLRGLKSREMTITPQIDYGNPVVASKPLTQEHFDEIEAHDGRLFIYGTVTYRTLGAWRYTNFAFFHLGNQIFMMAPVGNDAN